MDLNDNKYRRLFDAIPGYVTVQDRDLRLVATNKHFRGDFGDRPGAYCYEVYKGRSEKCTHCPVEKTFDDGRGHSSEELVTPQQGGEKQVIVYTSPIRDDQGEITGVLELSTDITQIKQLQERYRMLFEEVPCYISVQDRDLRILEVNRRFRTDFGDEIGERCYRVYKHRTEPCLDCPVARTFEDGEIHTSEEVVTSCAEEQINVLCSTAPLRDQHGNIDAVMEMSTNITKLRQVQSQLTSLGMLIGSVAHGIKGLLSGLDGGLYLMDTGYKKKKQGRIDQGQEMIRRNVDRIRSMVLNLLYYSRDREIFRQSIDLKELVTSVKNVMNRRAEQLGVDLSVQSAEGTLEGDYNGLHSVLINLVDNGIDACRVGKKDGPHEVRLTAGVEQDHIRFEVEDNGIGMDQETREKAFSLFFTSKGAEGTGLGLFIAHKMVSAHKGSIEIESTAGRGSRFVVKLPR